MYSLEHHANILPVKEIRGHLIALLFLLLVLVSSGPINLFHQHLDEENACLVEAEQETDPCHIRVFHSSTVVAQCEHPTHLHKKTVFCKLCEFARAVPVYVAPSSYSYFTCHAIEDAVVFYADSYADCIIIYTSGRGPPIKMIA